MDPKNNCGFCNKNFSSISAKNKHLRNVHKVVEIDTSKKSNILCPLCPNEKKKPLVNHDVLIKHLTQTHSQSIKQSHLEFKSLEEFEAWRNLENRDIDYASYGSSTDTNGTIHKYYNCNRSDLREFISKSEKRNSKCGGSIKISGVCPSRICAKIKQNGLVSVKYVGTHVGHVDELRTKRLSKTEQIILADKLTAGVSNERIIQDARKIENSKLERINIINRADLAYLNRKFNIDNKRHDMIASNLKVKECVAQRKNHGLKVIIQDNKVGNKIMNIERPTANSYKHRKIVEAHNKAEPNKVKNSSNLGEFIVKSHSVSDKCYQISYNDKCDEDCRSVYCPKCKICIHRYKCNCPDYQVKTAMCKHIHAVCIFEMRSDSVSPLSFRKEINEEDYPEDLYVEEPTTSKGYHKEEINDLINNLIKEKNDGRNSKTLIDFETTRKIVLEEVNNYLKTLNEKNHLKNLRKFSEKLKIIKKNKIFVKREKLKNSWIIQIKDKLRQNANVMLFNSVWNNQFIMR